MQIEEESGERTAAVEEVLALSVFSGKNSSGAYVVLPCIRPRLFQMLRVAEIVSNASWVMIDHSFDRKYRSFSFDLVQGIKTY